MNLVPWSHRELSTPYTNPLTYGVSPPPPTSSGFGGSCHILRNTLLAKPFVFYPCQCIFLSDPNAFLSPICLLLPLFYASLKIKSICSRKTILSLKFQCPLFSASYFSQPWVGILLYQLRLESYNILFSLNHNRIWLRVSSWQGWREIQPQSPLGIPPFTSNKRPGESYPQPNIWRGPSSLGHASYWFLGLPGSCWATVGHENNNSWHLGNVTKVPELRSALHRFVWGNYSLI
jgi:hypothetical protein